LSKAEEKEEGNELVKTYVHVVVACHLECSLKNQNEHLWMDLLSSVYKRAHVFYHVVCRLEAEVKKLREEADKGKETLEKGMQEYVHVSMPHRAMYNWEREFVSSSHRLLSRPIH
jgi:hypothetical protein